MLDLGPGDRPPARARRRLRRGDGGGDRAQILRRPARRRSARHRASRAPRRSRSCSTRPPIPGFAPRWRATPQPARGKRRRHSRRLTGALTPDEIACVLLQRRRDMIEGDRLTGADADLAPLGGGGQQVHGGHVFRMEMSDPLAPHSDERLRRQLLHRFPRVFDGRKRIAPDRAPAPFFALLPAFAGGAHRFPGDDDWVG